MDIEAQNNLGHEADDFVLEKSALEAYWSRRTIDRAALVAALENRSIQEFHQIGHRILGSARTYGYPNLEAIAKRMDKLSAEELMNDGPGIILDFQTWIDETQVLLNRVD